MTTPTHYVTYGQGHPQARCYSLLEASDRHDAHEQAHAARGRDWSHVYPIAELEADIAKGYLTGGEVPL